jgi:hypothetical protein
MEVLTCSDKPLACVSMTPAAKDADLSEIPFMHLINEHVRCANQVWIVRQLLQQYTSCTKQQPCVFAPFVLQPDRVTNHVTNPFSPFIGYPLCHTDRSQPAWLGAEHVAYPTFLPS